MINKLEQSCFFRNVYQMEDYTINQLLCSFFSKINECIDVSNESFNYLEWLKTEGLHTETSEMLNLWLEDGTLESLINVDKFNRLSAELTEKVDNLLQTTNTTISELSRTLTEQITRLDNTLSKKVEDMKIAVNAQLEENKSFVNNAVDNMNQSMTDFETSANLKIDNFKNDVNLQLNVFRNFIICTNVNEFKLALQKTGNKPTIIYLVNGTYTLDEILYIPDNTKIVGLGRVIINANGLNCYLTNKVNGTSLKYNGTKNIIIENIIFDGLNKADGLSMVAFAHAQNVLIEKCTFVNLHMWHMIELNATKNGIIRECHFENYGNTGSNATEVIQLDAMISESQFPWFGGYDSTTCRNILIENNTFENIGKSAIGNHSFKTGVVQKDIVIRNNFFDGVGTCITLSDFDNLLIEQNKAYNCHGFINSGSISNNCEHLVIRDNRYQGFFISSTDGLGDERFVSLNANGKPENYTFINVSITGNDVSLVPSHAIGLIADYLNISDNNFFRVYKHGIYHWGGFSGTIKGNNFRDVGMESTEYRKAIMVNGGGHPSKRVVVSENTVANLGGIEVSGTVEKILVCNNISAVENKASDNCTVSNNIN